MRIECLDSDEIAEAVLLASTPAAVRDVLLERPEMGELRGLVRSGSLTPEDVRSFVRGLLDHWKSGTRFPHEPALAALAVLLEEVPGRFAERTLDEMAALRVAEIPIAPRVARLCMDARKITPQSVTRFVMAPLTVASRHAQPHPIASNAPPASRAA